MHILEFTPGQKEFDRFVLTQANFAKQTEVLMEALKTAEVRGTTWFKETPVDRRIIEFEDLVKCAPERGTNLLKISAETREREDAHIIVNQLVYQYLEMVRDYNTGSFRDERAVYERELDDIDQQIRAKEEQLTNVGKKLPPGSLSSGANPVLADYEVDRQMVAQYEMMYQELSGLYSVYTQPRGAGLTPEDTQLVEMDPKIAYLGNQVFQLQQQMAVMRKNLGANHRHVKEIEKFIEVASQQLETEREKRLAEIVAYKTEQVRTAMLNTQHALLKAREKRADTMALLADMDEVYAQFISLQDDITLLKMNRDVLGGYIRELNRIVTERAAIRVELRTSAMEPFQRSFPRKFLIPAGVTLSLVLAIGIALMVEFMDTSLRTPQDVVRHLRVAVLGVVPDVDDEEVDIDQIETTVRDAPHSMYAEVFRTVRTNLQFTATAERQRTILITSPRPEDGKTSVACNLAIMVAQGGRRVLLIDANFRRPAVHRFFPPRSSKGLSNILVGDGTLADLVTPTDVPNLQVLTSGPVPPNPAELMGSPQLREFIDELAGKFDQVIIDGPPVLVASDATVLSTRVDGVIVVCRAKTNSRGVGNRACGLLSRVNAHIFGAILNAAQVRRGGYFREQLRTFYDYRLEEEEGDVSRRALPESEDEGESDEED
jgi:capsular exopolysaccharide synthesis family protein